MILVPDQVTMTVEESEAWHNVIQGWSTDILQWYDALAKVLPIGARVVEVGIYRGRSLLFLASELVRRFGTGPGFAPLFEVYGVDPLMWDGGVLARETYSNLIRFNHEVINTARILRAPSEMAARMFDDGSVDVVFLDGNHDHDSVKADIRAWKPKVRPGGILAGHDYTDVFGDFPGVKRAVDELVGAVSVSGSVWWATMNAKKRPK